jgi:membrane-associated phospholipid phosphatase
MKVRIKNGVLRSAPFVSVFVIVTGLALAASTARAQEWGDRPQFAETELKTRQTGAGPFPALSSVSSSSSSFSSLTSLSALGATPDSGATSEMFQGKSKGESQGEGRTWMGRLAADQREIWTSPAKLRWTDADWILPWAGIGGTLLATDASFGKSQTNSPGTIQRYKTISTAGVGALTAAAGGMWLWSYASRGGRHERGRQTGLLAGEAAVNTLAMVEALKYSLGRERPLQGDGSGPFFQSGRTSFPSEHAAAAWSMAGVIAHEYPGPLTRIAAYGLAAMVSLSRVRASQHFPSDALIGSVIGYMISQNIYARHTDWPWLHTRLLRSGSLNAGSLYARSSDTDSLDPGASDATSLEWRSFSASFRSGEDTPVENMGSPYVPLDSWVYPAIERLQALGYLHDAFAGTKPWTRTECARLIAGAEDGANEGRNEGRNSGANEATLAENDEPAAALLTALAREFHRERELQTGDANRSAALPSGYVRVLSASGAVLTDGYHFGQTYGYDYGRPFRRGTNFISGFATDFTSGRVFLHLSGEFQHAPAAPALSEAVRDVMAERDLAPIGPAQPFDAIDRIALMDSYLGVNLENWQISFGKQSLSWGPGPGGSLILSNNADPFYMVRIAQSRPGELPSWLGALGPVRLETFLGREKGHPLSGRPFIYGQKISLKPFPSLEFAYARTTTIGGTFDPLNTRTFFESYFGRVDAKERSVPGDSHTSVDWTWRLPGLRNRVVFYGEMESDDDPIPLQNLTRAVLRPGIYLVRLPFLKLWDFHAEWTSSDCPGKGSDDHGHLNYWNGSYRDGYTNNGNLVGNTVGREGKTIQAWTRYWIAPRQTLEFTAKNSEVDTDFIPGGGKWQDYRLTHEAALRSGISVRSFLQFERIGHFPLLFTGTRNNLTASIEIGFAPGRGH